MDSEIIKEKRVSGNNVRYGKYQRLSKYDCDMFLALKICRKYSKNKYFKSILEFSEKSKLSKKQIETVFKMMDEFKKRYKKKHNIK